MTQQPTDKSDEQGPVFSHPFDDTKLFLGQRGASARRANLVKRQGLMWWTGMHSMSPQSIILSRKVKEECNKHLPIDTRADGTSGPTGVNESFDAICTIANYGMDPIGIPAPDSSYFAKELSLPQDFLKREHKDLLLEMSKDFFGHVDNQGIYVREGTKSGIAQFETSSFGKRRLIEGLLARGDKPHRMLAYGNLERLFKEFGIVNTSIANKRYGSDVIGKERKVCIFTPDLFSKPVFVAADKSVRIPGLDVSDFSACRGRMVRGFNGEINGAYLAPVGSGCQNALYKRYPHTYHHRGDNYIADLLTRFCVTKLVGIDAHNFDATHQKFCYDVIFEGMADSWSEQQVEVIRGAAMAPYFVPASSINGRATWIGNPLDRNSRFFTGNPSGWYLVSIMNKLLMTWQMVCMLFDLGVPMLGGLWRRFLEWKMDIFPLNNGDDQLLGANEKGEELLSRLESAIKTGSIRSYFKLALEQGCIFSGSGFYRYGDKL